MGTTTLRPPHFQSDGASRAGEMLGQSVSTSREVAIMLVYLHGVERLYATLGHDRAATILDDVYTRLCGMARADDVIERVNDRKIAMLMSGLRNRGHVRLAAQKVERVIAETVVGEFEPAGLRSTAGVVLCPEHGRNPQELMRCAEVALLDGRHKNEPICFYEAASAQALFDAWGLEGRLANALEESQLELHYQPKLCLRTNRIAGVEALMRWNEPELGPISPDVFINLAEATGQITDLTDFAIQRACRQLSEWQGRWPQLTAAVNITPALIQSTEILDVLESATNIWGVAPESMTLEVTENSLMANPELSHEILVRIREYGSKVSIDDFGTGYSSLSYLKEIPADELKIDRTFVMGMMKDAGDRKIVEHSISIAQSFGLSVVAEGIETAESLAALTELGCDYAQGYYICKPLPGDEIEEFFRSREDAA